jgi:hypothetical protein
MNVAGDRARLEQIPKATMLRDDLLRAKHHRAFGGHSEIDRLERGQEFGDFREPNRFDLQTKPPRHIVDERTDRSPIHHQRERGTGGTAISIGPRKHVDRMMLREDRAFGIGVARRARQRADCDDESCKDRTLDGKRRSHRRDERPRVRIGSAIDSMIDDAGVAGMEQCKMVNGIGGRPRGLWPLEHRVGAKVPV